MEDTTKYRFTNQEAFDIAVRGVLGQGEPSIGGNGLCRYRGPSGRKCAAGWLLPDVLYHPGMEQSGNWEEVCESNPQLVNLADSRLVTALQAVHDNLSTNFDIWKNGRDPSHITSTDTDPVKTRFRKVAQTWGLSESVLEEFPDFPG